MISYVGVGCIPKVSNPKSLRMNAECGMISGLRSKDVLDTLPECIFISSQISLFWTLRVTGRRNETGMGRTSACKQCSSCGCIHFIRSQTIVVNNVSADSLAGQFSIRLVYTHKNVEPVLSLVPRQKGSRIARQIETSNAESPTPVYIYRQLSWL